MTEPALRKGYCPGVLAPMAARDGLLVRVRVPGGRLPATSARRIAELGRRCGNGLIELSQRANLQLRGIRVDTLDELTEGLRALGLVSQSVASEAVRNVLSTPTAGLDRAAVLDVYPLALALDARLAEDDTLHGLPPKFAMIVDGGGCGHLADSSADIRFDAASAANGPSFRLSLGGDLRSAQPLGLCLPDHLVDMAAAVARAFIELRTNLAEPPRRMPSLLDAVGIDAVRERVPQLRPLTDATAPERPSRLVLGPHGHWLGVAFPFGRLDCDALEGLAALSRELRLTPWRALLLPGATAGDAAAVLRLGGILDATDPRLAVAACSGAAGCEAGSTDTHADALAIAHAARDLLAAGRSVHVSGCAKGCAHPAPADVTLTARDGAYEIALNAVPGAPAWRSGLTPGEAAHTVAGLGSEELSRV